MLTNALQNVVDAISSAGFAMQELAKEQAHIDKHTLHKAVEYFLDQIEASLMLSCSQSQWVCLGNEPSLWYCPVCSALVLQLPCSRQQQLQIRILSTLTDAAVQSATAVVDTDMALCN